MVPPLEQAAAAAFLNNVMGRLFEVLELVETYRMLRDLKRDTESLREDLRMLAANTDDELTRWRGARRTAVARAYSEEMRVLMHDIEDCIERFLHRVTCKKRASWLRRAAHGVKTLYPCRRFAAEIKMLKERLQEARNRILNPPGGGQPSSSTAAPERRPRPPDHAERCPHPVGIGQPKVELLALLDEVEGQQQELRVISIVGFGGVGKTTLARAVYDDRDVADKFPCRAWVAVRSLEHSDATGILRYIHQKLLTGQQYSETSLTDYLQDKRYLIVIDEIDDIEEEQWDTITSTFRANGESSRIVVTTTCLSTARKRSNGNGYVYEMRTLGNEDSMTIALRGRSAYELVQGSATLLKKCDGLPLALVSVARQLSSEIEPTGQFCKELSSILGSYLEREDNEPNFARLRGVLMDNYTSLSNLTVRTCLLYLGMFPIDRPLRRDVIVRRWLAEGYAWSNDCKCSEHKVANGNFETFIDRNIIQAVETGSDAKVKMCKTHGIMHEFLLQRSINEKFIMSFQAGSNEKVRHLFVHDGNDTNSTTTLNMDLSCVRSLTVLGQAGDAISDFGKYKLMRVLDLEECSNVNDRHLKDICKLWNLRYLSLGDQITMLPKKIAKLKLLETLNISKTRVNVLPMEVIGLPCLINLIGKFKLPDQDGTGSSKLEKLSKKSKLETLEGSVADGSQGFLQLMVYMKNLRKVKIWCESTGDITNLNNHLLQAIQKYTAAPMGEGDVRSLSIHFQGLPEPFPYPPRDLCNHTLSLKKKYYLTSLKLHGNSSTSPEFVASLYDLTELCLSSTTMTRDFLETLSGMPSLLYLKLIADQIDEGFVIKVGAFQSLRRLGFVVRGPNPILPEIQDEALPELVSLRLLFEHLAGLSGIDIRRLKKLEEVVLHPNVDDQTRREWEAAARNHPKRPNVLSFERIGDPTENPGSAREVAAADQTGIQGHEGSEPSAMQTELANITNSTSTTSGHGNEMDDSTHHEPTENPVAPDASDQAGVQYQKFDGGLEHPPVKKGMIRWTASPQSDILNSTSNSSRHKSERDDSMDCEPPESTGALEESTHGNEIQEQPVECSEHSSVQTGQKFSTPTKLGLAGQFSSQCWKR